MSVVTSKYFHGWKPDLPDQRDHLYAAHFLSLVTLPSSVDLRPQCPPVYDQGQLGSCTSQAIAGAIEFDQIKQKLPEATPSRLFIYYNERAMEGTVASDAGAAIRDGIKSVNKQGACNEMLWPYDISQFAVQPPIDCYQAAQTQRTLLYQRVPRNLTQMKACLASGCVFVFGFTVYQSFESAEVAQTGVVPMPAHGETVLGGHCMLLVGFEDEKQWFVARNSWGTSFGDQGYVYMPYAYILSNNLSSDFWTIRTIT